MLILLTIISTSAAATDIDTYDTDYLALMIEAATQGDFEAGQALEAARNTKIDELGLDYVKISFEDLFYLSRQMYIECGSEWLSDDWQLAVGNVVLNRVEGEDWPDTVKEVIYHVDNGVQQYAHHDVLPDERTVENALRLLEGERVLPVGVVYQSNGPQGSGTYEKMHDNLLGTTWLCWR